MEVAAAGRVLIHAVGKRVRGSTDLVVRNLRRGTMRDPGSRACHEKNRAHRPYYAHWKSRSDGCSHQEVLHISAEVPRETRGPPKMKRERRSKQAVE